LVIAVMAAVLGTGVPAAAAQGGADSSSGSLGLEVRAVTTPSASAVSQGRAAKKKCAGLKGNKLRRCRAIAKCKKLRGKKRRRCLAKARKIGVKKKQQPPQAKPPSTQPPSTQPPPPPNQPPANRAPFWPSPFQSQATTQFHYDPTTGYLIGATTTINALTPAVDPDGDPLTYTWTVSNGSITANGLSATWTRVIEFGHPKSGTATVTASDGKGGAAPFEFRFL
jgi:hypothetical protein